MDKLGNHSELNTSGSTDVEMGSVRGHGSKRQNPQDPNHIHFVSVGRVKDGRILISAITNRRFQSFQTRFLEHAE